MPRDLSGSWDSPGQTRRAEEGADGPQVGKKGQKGKKGKKRTKKGNKEKECIKKQLQKKRMRNGSGSIEHRILLLSYSDWLWDILKNLMREVEAFVICEMLRDFK